MNCSCLKKQLHATQSDLLFFPAVKSKAFFNMILRHRSLVIRINREIWTYLWIPVVPMNSQWFLSGSVLCTKKSSHIPVQKLSNHRDQPAPHWRMPKQMFSALPHSRSQLLEGLWAQGVDFARLANWLPNISKLPLTSLIVHKWSHSPKKRQYWTVVVSLWNHWKMGKFEFTGEIPFSVLPRWLSLCHPITPVQKLSHCRDQPTLCQRVYLRIPLLSGSKMAQSPHPMIPWGQIYIFKKGGMTAKITLSWEGKSPR